MAEVRGTNRVRTCHNPSVHVVSVSSVLHVIQSPGFGLLGLGFQLLPADIELFDGVSDRLRLGVQLDEGGRVGGDLRVAHAGFEGFGLGVHTLDLLLHAL